jgi:hypothetical protein
MKLMKKEVRAHKNAVTNIKDDLLLLFLGTGFKCWRHETGDEKS